MKKITVATGYVSAFLFLIGISFKTLHYPGANISITVACVIFALFYGVLLFMDKSKLAENSYQKFIAFYTFLLILIIPATFLFKTMHWPGAGLLPYIAHLLLLIAIPLLIIYAVKAKDQVKKLNFHHEAIILIMLTSFVISMFYSHPESGILKTFVPVNKTVITEMKYQENKSNELFTMIENAVNSKTAANEYLEKANTVKNACDSFNQYIVGIENLLITTAEIEKGNADSLETICPLPFYDAVNKVMFLDTLKIKEYKDKLKAYKDLMEQNTNSRGKEIISLFFNTEKIKCCCGDSCNWEDMSFKNKPLAAVLLSFNQTRSIIRLLESETMTYIQAVAATSRPVVTEEKKEPAKK